MATMPSKIEKFSTIEIDAFSTIAMASWQKAAGLLEYVNASYPVGMLLFFHAQQAILPEQPDPKYWHFCDGSAVSNANSVFNGVSFPDFRNKFIKHPGTGQIVLAEAGANAVTLTHNHGGVTGEASDYDSLNMDNGEERGQGIGGHHHNISSALGLTSTIPAYYEVQVYVRVT